MALSPTYFQHGLRPFWVDLRAQSWRRVMLLLVAAVGATFASVKYHRGEPWFALAMTATTIVVNYGRIALSSNDQTP
jgi:membrane protein YdbS with pleckstrin-like domain